MERILRKLASKSDHEHYKHACLIVRGSNIIAQGFNKGAKHAEISAIGVKHKKDSSYFHNSTLYSFRFNKSGPANSRPCQNCESLIRSLMIREIVYFWDGQLVTERV